MNARSQAIARQDSEIEASTQRAIAARAAEGPRRMSALESMSMRLGVTESELQDALVKTVFSGCRNRSEFLALVIVSNEYRLNPLTKEIYAFPAKGGGVVPMVSVDGWITLMNSHPAFDGIEFIYHNDAKGKTVAIESVIYRKDRNHPTKTIEYLDECKGNSQPWQKTERRMLRHRALIQGARIAFGFSGVYAPGDEDLIDAEYREAPSARSLPSNEQFAQYSAVDDDTGKVLPTDPATGMTIVNEEEARALDAAQGGDAGDGEGHDAETGEVVPDGAGVDPFRGEVWAERRREILDLFNIAETVTHVRAADELLVRHLQGFPGEIQQELEKAATDARNRIKKQAKA